MAAFLPTERNLGDPPPFSDQYLDADGLIAFGQAVKYLNSIRAEIQQQVNRRVYIQKLENHYSSLYFKNILDQSTGILDKVANIPLGAAPSFSKTIKDYGGILSDVYETSKSNDIIPTIVLNGFNDRIDTFVKEFKKKLVAMQAELLQPPEMFQGSHKTRRDMGPMQSSELVRPPENSRPSEHSPSSHMFQDSNVIINGGNFIQNNGTDVVYLKLYVILGPNTLQVGSDLLAWNGIGPPAVVIYC